MPEMTGMTELRTWRKSEFSGYSLICTQLDSVLSSLVS
jgi:hypothetical protein